MVRALSDDNDNRTEQFRKLFIGGLTPITTEERLKDYYSKWGEIVDVVVMKDPRSGRSRGFGFVTYKEPEMVDDAQSNRPHEIDGKTVEAKRAMPREDSSNPESHMTVNKLFIGGLKKDVTTKDLEDYFSNYGNITECEVVIAKETGISRGFGFVTFDDYDPVDKAILYKPHMFRNGRSDVKKALSRDQMNTMKRKQEYRNDNVSGYYNGNQNRGYPQPVNHAYGKPYSSPGVLSQDQIDNSSYSSGDWTQYAPNGNQGWGSSVADGFGQYANQQSYSGGPMRSGTPGDYQRNQTYSGAGSMPYERPERPFNDGYGPR